MFCIYKDEVFTECVGNIVFSPNVFQTAESLTEDQRVQFDVYQVFEDFPELSANSEYIKQWTYRVEGRQVIRTWGQAPIPMEERLQRIAKNIDKLWTAADAYQSSYISGVAIGLLTIGVLQQKPKSLAIQAWVGQIWDEYYSRKAAVTFDVEPNLDFSAFGPIPHTVPELRAEVGVG